MERLTLRDDDGRALLTPYGLRIYCSTQATADCICKLEEEMNALFAFKSYFDNLYGDGLNVANFHLNGATEPFDNFYDSAMEEYENAKRADTQRDYQAAVEMTEYCERYEPTYNQEDGGL